MKKKSLAGNIGYNVLIQAAAVVFPFLLTPYVSRVLSADLIGHYAYAEANCSYFLLVALGGLPLYGTLKASALRDDVDKRSKLFWEITLLKTLFLGICTIFYLVWIGNWGNVQQRPLQLIMILTFISNAADSTWFLNGMEEFRTVAVRSVGVRILHVVTIMLLVRNESDFYIYAFLMQGVVLISHCVSLPAVCKLVKWTGRKQLNIFTHVRPSLVYFVPGLANTVFSYADKTVLGAFTANAYEVGVYTQANKIIQLCVSLISAISNAFLPRVAYLHANQKDSGESKALLTNALRLGAVVAFPMMFGIAAISDHFVTLFFGPGYEKSALLIKVLCFNVLFSSMRNFITHQCLIGRGRQKEDNIAVTLSSVINLVLNLMLVSRYQSVGVSAACAVTGFSTFAFAVWFSRDIIRVSDLMRLSKKYLLASVVMFLVIMKINVAGNALLTVAAQITAGALVYAAVLIFAKEELISDIRQFIQKRG